MKHYKAPWGRTLVIMSVLATLLCAGIPLRMWTFLCAHGTKLPFWIGFPILLLVPVCALFIVHGYTITPDEILIHRPFWSTRLPRAGLLSATASPKAMRGSIRTCGNGGFFSFTGFYWSKSLGAYHAYVTNLRLTVVLRFASRTVVVSPDDPEGFARSLNPDP